MKKKEKIAIAVHAARRFILKAEAWEKRIQEDKYALISGSKEGAACKRASMDLSRVLSDIRRG